MNQDQELQDKYDNHIIDLIRQLPNTKYIFEITKCCNYSTFVLVNKRGTLLDLYKEVSNCFECRTMQQLYVVSPLSDELTTIPMTDVLSIKDYIRTNPTLFVPIYPVPNCVVYRVYLDDGHSHTEECSTRK